MLLSDERAKDTSFPTAASAGCSPWAICGIDLWQQRPHYRNRSTKEAAVEIAKVMEVESVLESNLGSCSIMCGSK